MLLSLERDDNVHPDAIAVAEEVLAVYDEMNQAITIDSSNENRHATQLCLSFYAAKIQRVTRAALTLILASQGEEAMSLIREQHDFVTALNYYHERPSEAVLFMASEPLKKRDYARQVMKFDERAQRSLQRQQQLTTLEEMAEQAYRHFPGLRSPKGKSRNSTSPQLTDWSEPGAKTMLTKNLRVWLRDYYAKSGELFTEEEFTARLKKSVDRIYFMRNTFISQAKHGTAFSIGNALQLDGSGRIKPIKWQVEDPNGLAFHFVSNAMPPLKIICEFNGLTLFEDRLNRLGVVSQQLRETLGIEQEAIPPIRSESPCGDGGDLVT